MDKHTDRSEPLVSVIIPAYNAAAFLPETLRSVLAQTWQNLEVIVVNDGSKDNTDEVMSAFTDDKRIVYINQENKGCSGAKNTGLQAATGDFIQYLDADDLLSPDKIAEQAAVLKGRPWDIAVCRTKVFAKDITVTSGEIDTEFLYTTEDTLGFLLNLYGISGKDGMIQPNAFLMGRQVAKETGVWDMSISPSPDEDGEYFCRALLKAGKLWFTPRGINYYRKDPASKSLSKQHSYRHAKGALRSIELKADHLLQREDSERIKSLMARHFSSFMYVYYPAYPDLVKEAEEKIHAMGIEKIAPQGGDKFNKIARVLGYSNTLKLKSLFQKSRRSGQ